GFFVVVATGAAGSNPNTFKKKGRKKEGHSCTISVLLYIPGFNPAWIIFYIRFCSFSDGLKLQIAQVCSFACPKTCPVHALLLLTTAMKWFALQFRVTKNNKRVISTFDISTRPFFSVFHVL
ncbi:hypothetical protein E2320_019787, partial [Naja naja]